MDEVYTCTPTNPLKAHNVESACNEMSSFELSTTTLQEAYDEVVGCKRVASPQSSDGEPTQSDLTWLAEIIQQLITALKTERIEKSSTVLANVKPPSFVYELLERVGVSVKYYGMLDQICNGVPGLWARAVQGKRRSKRLAIDLFRGLTICRN